MTRIFEASRACPSFFSTSCSKVFIGVLSRLLSCPRSIFFDALSSSIFSFNGFLFLTSLLLFYFFNHFDPSSVYVSSAQFVLRLSSSLIHNQGPTPPNFDSLPSKRRKVIKRGIHTSTYHTCDHTRMSTESSQKYIGSPSTPIPTIVNGTPSTPSTTMVIVSEVPIINPVHPIVNTQSIAMNHFGSLCHSSSQYSVHPYGL
jgi:hypothetical protein